LLKLNNTVKLSNFDIFVNKILKESLASGRVSSTSFKPAEAQKETKTVPILKTQDGKNVQQQQRQVYQNTEPAQETEQPVEQEVDGSEQQDAQEDILSQLKDDSKKRDEFEKKFIAVLTNMNRGVQTTTQPTVINPKQMFGANISL
jgi:hypothetical protein